MATATAAAGAGAAGAGTGAAGAEATATATATATAAGAASVGRHVGAGASCERRVERVGGNWLILVGRDLRAINDIVVGSNIGGEAKSLTTTAAAAAAVGAAAAAGAVGGEDALQTKTTKNQWNSNFRMSSKKSLTQAAVAKLSHQTPLLDSFLRSEGAPCSRWCGIEVRRHHPKSSPKVNFSLN